MYACLLNFFKFWKDSDGEKRINSIDKRARVCYNKKKPKRVA